MAIRFKRGTLELLDKKALLSIAQTLPDGVFADHVQAAIPRLQRRGWLLVIEHSDGHYVDLTDLGRDALGWQRQEAET